MGFRELIKERLRYKKYVEVIIIGKGINKHSLIEYLEAGMKYEDYSINNEDLFIKNRSYLQRFKDWIKKKGTHFMIYFYKDNPEAISSSKYVSPKLTSQVLDIAERSQALGKAMSELFRGRISGRTILFIGIIVIVGALLYFILFEGGITLPV